MIDEIERHTFLIEPLSRTPVVLDLGLNRGSFSRPMAAKYGVRIVGVEPMPDLFEALPHVPNATFEQCAVSGDGKPVKLFLSPGTDASIVEGLAVDGADTIETDAITLRDLMDRHGVDRAGLCKMDIEGAELDILDSADPETLNRLDQLAVEFHDFIDPSQAPRVQQCIKRLTGLNFAAIRFSVDNTNVLFVNQSRYPVGAARRAWLKARYKYPQGLSRVIQRRLK